MQVLKKNRELDNHGTCSFRFIARSPRRFNRGFLAKMLPERLFGERAGLDSRAEDLNKDLSCRCGNTGQVGQRSQLGTLRMSGGKTSGKQAA